MPARFIYLYYSHTVWNPGPPNPGPPSLIPGVSLKKYLKSCNKITSKEMRGLRSHEGAEKRTSSLPWIPAWAGGRTTPLLSRYIPAIGEVRGQGMKVPVCEWGGEQKQAVRRCPPLPTQLGTAQSRQAALFEQGP